MDLRQDWFRVSQAYPTFSVSALTKSCENRCSVWGGPNSCNIAQMGVNWTLPAAPRWVLTVVYLEACRRAEKQTRRKRGLVEAALHEADVWRRWSGLAWCCLRGSMHSFVRSSVLWFGHHQGHVLSAAGLFGEEKTAKLRLSCSWNTYLGVGHDCCVKIAVAFPCSCPVADRGGVFSQWNELPVDQQLPSLSPVIS